MLEPAYHPTVLSGGSVILLLSMAHDGKTPSLGEGSRVSQNQVRSPRRPESGVCALSSPSYLLFLSPGMRKSTGQPWCISLTVSSSSVCPGSVSSSSPSPKPPATLLSEAAAGFPWKSAHVPGGTPWHLCISYLPGQVRCCLLNQNIFRSSYQPMMFFAVPATSPARVPVTLGWQDPERDEPEWRYSQAFVAHFVKESKRRGMS